MLLAVVLCWVDLCPAVCCRDYSALCVPCVCVCVPCACKPHIYAPQQLVAELNDTGAITDLASVVQGERHGTGHQVLHHTTSIMPATPAQLACATSMPCSRGRS